MSAAWRSGPALRDAVAPVAVPVDAAGEPGQLRIGEPAAGEVGDRDVLEQVQRRDVLLRALQGRYPDLAERHAVVARMVDAVTDRLGLPADERAQTQQAAELHDIGKLGIPEGIRSTHERLDGGGYPTAWPASRSP